MGRVPISPVGGFIRLNIRSIEWYDDAWKMGMRPVDVVITPTVGLKMS